MTTKITSTKDLIPGILYCLFETQYCSRTGAAHDWAGALVYWTGEEFMYEDGDECHDGWDYAVAQADKPNSDYIAGPSYVPELPSAHIRDCSDARM